MITQEKLGINDNVFYNHPKEGKFFLGRVIEIKKDFELILNDGSNVVYFDNEFLENRPCQNLNHRH